MCPRRVLRGSKTAALLTHKQRAFVALSAREENISEWWMNELNIRIWQNGPASATLLCILASAFAKEQLTGSNHVFSSEDGEGEYKQWGSTLASAFCTSYHCHHLQVLHVRPFGGQQLLGDEVCPICWEPLWNRDDTERQDSRSCSM